MRSFLRLRQKPLEAGSNGKSGFGKFDSNPPDGSDMEGPDWLVDWLVAESDWLLDTSHLFDWLFDTTDPSDWLLDTTWPSDGLLLWLPIDKFLTEFSELFNHISSLLIKLQIKHVNS